MSKAQKARLAETTVRVRCLTLTADLAHDGRCADELVVERCGR